MKCLKCGLDINPGEKFCKNCGAEVIDQQVDKKLSILNSNQNTNSNSNFEPNYQKKKTNPIIIIFGLIPVLFVLFIICTVLVSSLGEKQIQKNDDLTKKVVNFVCDETVYYGSSKDYCKEEFITYLDNQETKIKIEHKKYTEENIGELYIIITMNNKEILHIDGISSVSSLEVLEDLLVINYTQYVGDSGPGIAVDIYNNKGERVLNIISDDESSEDIKYIESFEINENKIIFEKAVNLNFISDLAYDAEEENLDIRVLLNRYNLQLNDLQIEKYEIEYFGNSKFSKGIKIGGSFSTIEDYLKEYHEELFE